MNIKLTARFVITIVLINVFIFFINVTLGMVSIIKNSSQGFVLVEPMTYKEVKLDPESFTRVFGDNIELTNDEIIIRDEGKKSLDENNLWVQVLDENGKEIINYKKPKEVQNEYAPVDIVNAYKYTGGAEGLENILVSSVDIGDRKLSYIINFPMNKLSKTVIMYSQNIMGNLIKDILTGVLIMDSLIAIIGGLLFSRRLTKPVGRIIDGVKTLSMGNYNLTFKEKGIYSNVFRNLNALSSILKENEAERKKNEKMREEWIANISHDIKTPLASIRGYSELINGDYDFTEEEIQEYGEIIYQKSLYITELVNDLNLSTRLKNNALFLKKGRANLVSLTKEVIIAILNDNKYSNRDIEFIPKTEVAEKEVDILLLKRCLTNLIFNAIVHNDEDVKIRVELEKRERIYITISDNGKGISEEDLKHIFDRYYRGTNTGELHKGSGLGMAISKEIIKNHGGDVKIESKLKEGTKITIIL
ncbi:HAMP domain-containing sensor histidine kinase [Clostridium senegalense]|uniref:HAMP domain-containing sensor histidine kinase n=1 Tax=Clostridium senegalense TaxID=1465809 RepID=UPI000287E128|nr:HAMP domain-containing sensor histidine kinase [Clostridium senegalense]